jgi:magnesium chelatase family protein
VIASIPSAVVLGVDGRPVSGEVHVSNRLPGLTMVGLPDAAVRESRERVRAALVSSGLPWPRRRITVNLAPSGMRNAGAGLDAAIAMGILVASGVLGPETVEGFAFVGELGLDGSLRGVPAIMVLADALPDHRLVVAGDSLAEARIAGGACVSASSLTELVARCSGRRPWVDPPRTVVPDDGDQASDGDRPGGDLSDVLGQPVARRALEVAAGGGHHLLLVGPPGAGKTMLATRLAGPLPHLDRRISRDVTRIHSAAGEPRPRGGLVVRLLCRAPHHGVSAVAPIGGGSATMPSNRIRRAEWCSSRSSSRMSTAQTDCGSMVPVQGPWITRVTTRLGYLSRRPNGATDCRVRQAELHGRASHRSRRRIGGLSLDPPKYCP